MREATKEMTLDEWVNTLPKFHFANRQYQDLTAALAKSERKREKAERWKELTKCHAPYEAAIAEFRQRAEAAESRCAAMEKIVAAAEAMMDYDKVAAEDDYLHWDPHWSVLEAAVCQYREGGGK